jgi:phytoene/squalene synthetase
MLDRRLALDVTLFSRGGMYILDKIERQGFDVLTARPHISKSERVRLLLRALIGFAITRAAA